MTQLWSMFVTCAHVVHAISIERSEITSEMCFAKDEWTQTIRGRVGNETPKAERNQPFSVNIVCMFPCKHTQLLDHSGSAGFMINIAVAGAWGKVIIKYIIMALIVREQDGVEQ